jgi:hypothetical protein
MKTSGATFMPETDVIIGISLEVAPASNDAIEQAQTRLPLALESMDEAMTWNWPTAWGATLGSVDGELATAPNKPLCLLR